jgi:hypothetical protein
VRFVTDYSKGILGKPDSTELWEELTSYIPDKVLLRKNVKILCIAVGHGTEADVLVRRMKALGRSDEDIKNSIYLIDKYKVFTNAALRKGYTNVVQKDFMEWKPRIKFDVAVGNGPFQSEKGNSDQLWPLFTERAISLTKKNGYIGFIIPDTWTSGTRSLMSTGRKNLLSEVFANFNVKLLHFDIKKYFPGVGSGFSAFILENTAPKGLTKIISPIDEFDIDISKLKYIPKTINKITLDIVRKITQHNKECVYFKFYGKTPDLELVDTKDKTHQFAYEYSNTSSNHPTKWGNVPGQGYNRKKVIYAYMGSKQKFEYDLTGNISLMYNCRAYEVDDNATVEGLQSFFESKLVRFLNKDKWSQYNEPKILNLLPKLDFSRKWTDQEIYEYFDLDQNAIDYIENFFI